MKKYSDYIFEEQYWDNLKEEYFNKYYPDIDIVEEGKIWQNIKNFFKRIFNIKDKDDEKKRYLDRYPEYDRWRRNNLSGSRAPDLNTNNTDTNNVSAKDLNNLNIGSAFTMVEGYGLTDEIKTIVTGMTPDNGDRGYKYFKTNYFDNNKFYKTYKNCLYLFGKLKINKNADIPFLLAFGYFDPEGTEFILEDVDFIQEFNSIKEWEKLKTDGIMTDSGKKIIKIIKNNHKNVKKITYELKSNNPWTSDIKKYFVKAGFTYDANDDRLTAKIS